MQSKQQSAAEVALQRSNESLAAACEYIEDSHDKRDKVLEIVTARIKELSAVQYKYFSKKRQKDLEIYTKIKELLEPCDGSSKEV